MTPQQRTRDNLTARGYLVGTVEKKKKFPDKKRRPCKACGNQPMIEISSDLWEVFDIVAIMPSPLMVHMQGNNHNRDGECGSCTRCGSIHESPHPVFVQTTSRNNHSTRRNKILASMEGKLVLLSGAHILIQSWRQEGEAGSRWKCFDEWITLDMYDSAPHYPSTVAELVEIKRKAKKEPLPRGSTLPIPTEDFDNLPF